MSSSKIQEKSCPICFTEETEKFTKHILLHCGSSCCQGCLVEWLGAKIRENYSHNTDVQVPCIFSGCKGTLQVQQISSQLSNENKLLINGELFQAYLNSQQDVRRCPQKNCPYAGIITPMPCGKDLQCELCSKTWTDKIQQTKTRKMLSFLKGLFFAKNEILCQLWKIAFSKKCPHCKTSIVKNEGCDHITCLKCGAEFCWQCPSRYPAHNSTIHKCYPILMKIILFIIGLFIIGLFGGFAYMIPPLKFVMDWTVVPVWNWTSCLTSWMFGWVIWSFCLFRDFFVFNSILMCFANALAPRNICNRGIRIGGHIFGWFFCFFAYYFEIVWPVVKFGCIELGLAFVIIYGGSMIKRNKKKAL